MEGHLGGGYYYNNQYLPSTMVQLQRTRIPSNTLHAGIPVKGATWIWWGNGVVRMEGEEVVVDER